MRIGFIGLGHMGNPMVHNLLKAGYSVSIFDVVPEAMQTLAKQGATITTSLREIAEKSDVIFTMLQTGSQVEEVCLAEDGLFTHANKNLLYIDSSSIEINTTLKLHQEAQRLGIAMLDSPVSGGVAGAEAATLTIMVGGNENHFTKALPLLEKLGKKIIHAGPNGSGQAAKICNNLILGISMIAVCEGFNLSTKLGLDPKKFFDISSSASGQCWSMTSYCPVPGLVEKSPANFDYQPGFMAKMMLKDLRLALHAAETAKATLPLGAEAAELYSLFVNQGHGDLDFSAIMQMIAGKS
jgi:3-hydroxyisobutyrate dehydrogenase